MSNGGRADGASSSHRSSPIPRGPSTPTSSSPFSDATREGLSILADRYTMLTPLGRGANGRVYKAFDQEGCRYVAVKEISLSGVSKEQLTSVVGEIDLLKNLDHENIVQYYDSIKTNNHLYIILEYMESGSLATVMKHTNYGAFPERWVAPSVVQVLKGLKYLHAQGVVHRDIKGANILTTKDMVIKLADFGVAAKLANRGSNGSREEYYNTIAGSPYWMAPEVIEMKSVTTAADIWSIGCLVVELLTGSAPYFDCQPAPALYRIVQDKHPPLPQGISHSLRSFLLSCFIKDPRKRPTAEDLLRHDWICQHQDRSASPNKLAPKASSPASASVPPPSSARSVVERIFQHKMRPSRPPSEPTSDIEPGASPERADSPLASQLSRSSSAIVNEIAPEATDGEDEYEHLRQRRNVDKFRKSSASNPQALPRCPIIRSRNESMAHSDAGGTFVRKKEEWREDVYKDATSTLIGSGTSSPDTRIHSPGLPGKEESVLGVIFSERIYDFESGLHRSRAGENWSIYESSQPTSSSGRIQGAVVGESYDPKNIQKVLSSLHPHLPLSSVLPALRDLVNLTRDDVEARSVFIHTDGLLTLLELLQFDDIGVIEQTLFLSNCVCGEDATMLKDAAAVGLAAEIFKFAHSSYPLTVRIESAKFLRSMSFASIKTRDCLIQCQGLKHLIVLLEDGERKSLDLKETAMECMGRILVDHGSIESRIMRMLCMADLPKRLISALSSIHQNYAHVSPQGATEASDPVPTSMQLARQQSSSTDTLSEECAPCTPQSEISSCLSHHRQSSDASSAAESNPEEPTKSSDVNKPSPIQSISEKITNLLLKISTSDSEVHGHLVQSTTLQQMLLLLRLPPKDMIHQVVICFKNLSLKPSVVELLQEAGALGHLIPLLGETEKSVMVTQIQIEALIVIDNICKCSPQWRQKAVRHGIVPYLAVLSRSPVQTTLRETRDDENNVRKYSIPLLCRLLTLSTASTRQMLWEHDVVTLFLQLLDEEKWHQVVLDALATWLEEDIHRVEERLVTSSSVHNLIAILRGYRYRSSNEISAVLDPLLRMLNRSDKLSRTAGLDGLAQVILDMLKEADAATCLNLLKALKRIYGMHPRPKEFINFYGVQQHLDHLVRVGDRSAADDRVLVRREASNLLAAFQMNQIW